MKYWIFALLLPTAALATPYGDALDHACPQKHLNRLTAGDLDFGLENYQAKLPRRADAALTRRMLAARTRDCAQVIAGLSCSNGAAICAMTKSELAGFVHYLCGLPVTCDSRDPCRLPGS